MIWRKGILVIACFLLFIHVVSAEIPDLLTVSGSPDWLVANTVDTSTITTQVRNLTSGNPVSAVPVIFFVEDFLYGNVSSSDAVTNGFGFATTTFKVNKTSGIALIHAVVSYTTGGSTITNEVIYPQKIDHGPAYSSPLDYQGEVIVDQTTPFILTLKDLYGNRVDNKNPAYVHTVKFVMNFPPGGLGTGGLKNATSAYLTTVYDSTDSKGNISLTAKVDTVPGENNINIFPIENMPDILHPYIVGITQAPSFSIEQVVSPDDPPTLLADQVSSFSIQYTLYDKFRNTAGSQQLHIFASETYSEGGNTFEHIEDLGNKTSNSLGQIRIEFGPRSTTGSINITAVAVANASVHCSKTVEFLSTDPVSMVVTANPQMMPSRDVPADPPVNGEIIAKIMDIMGNPVEGEAVGFNLTGYTPDSANLTKLPSFSSSTYLTATGNTTDPNGNAVVTLYAGEFPTYGMPKYNSGASGTATIEATWQGKTMPITVTFKNYPYLRIETLVTPPKVNVTDTFDVDIKLIGDGWKLFSYPIDVELVLDRSGSMSGTDVSPSRLAAAKTAATTFVNAMNDYKDRVGLFSYSSASDVTRNAGLQRPFGPVKTAITTLTTNGATATRLALKNAIEDLITNPNSDPKTVRAVILMTDGDWNNEGTPLAHGTGWPAGSPGYTFSGTNLEPDNYRYYTGLGGTLVEPTPVAYFTASAGSSTKYKVQFTDESVNSPTSWSWNFGDGGTSTSQSPSHTYASTGSYTVSLTVTNAVGTHTLTRTATVTWSSNKTKVVLSSATAPTPSYTKCTNGEFTNQNLSIYAKNNNIRLYMITFASVPTPTAVSGLTTLAVATGGFYQHAPNAASLNETYTKIAGELKTEAGVNTQMNLSFENVNVTYNNVTTSMEGKDVFEYIYKSGVSTWVTSWNKTQNPLQDHVPKPPTPPYMDVLPNFVTYTTYPYSFNQRDEWLSTSGLKFNAGNISINQTWETKFRFRVNQSGNIDIFGPGSKIVFNNGESVLELPHTYVSAVPNLTNVGLYSTELDIYNLHSTGSTVTNDYIPLSWQINYGGTEQVIEEISWQKEGGNWKKFDLRNIDNNTHTDYSILDVRGFEPGTYYIRVKATAPDAADDIEYITAPGFTVGTAGRIYIKLE